MRHLTHRTRLHSRLVFGRMDGHGTDCTFLAYNPIKNVAAAQELHAIEEAPAEEQSVLRRQVFVKGLPVGAADERAVAAIVGTVFRHGTAGRPLRQRWP